ncbi:hypothetical protein BDZ91DRAFT_847108 [Kalaharituber pfeilii]|nr:hypothetical protein BDZ91DRAFT_847108 [Kalaharituber pfeilii]
MQKTSSIFFFGALLPVVMGHIGMWHPSVYGFNGDGYSIVEPLSNKGFDKWWMHGQTNNPPKNGAVLELPAGGKVTIELACNKAQTSFGGRKDGNDPCPPDTPSMHAGTPVKDNLLRGCALAIAYTNDIKKAKPEDFTVFSVNQKCVKNRYTDFQVPTGMPACNGKCICAWFWQGQESANEMYMNGFDCTITNPGKKVLSKPQVPTECKNGNGCVTGARQPMYWANNGSQNIKFSGDYFRKPAYNDNWGFKDGAQNDIFEAGSLQQTPSAEEEDGQEPPVETPAPEAPADGPTPVTVTVTVTAAGADCPAAETVTVTKRGRSNRCEHGGKRN